MAWAPERAEEQEEGGETGPVGGQWAGMHKVMCTAAQAPPLSWSFGR